MRLATKIAVVLAIFVLAGCGSAMRWENEPGTAPISRSASSTRAASRASTPPRRRVAQSGNKTNYHSVVDGDTLYSIAWRYQLDYRNLANWNGKGNSTLIYAGERLRLTPPSGNSVRGAQSNQQPPAGTATAAGNAQEKSGYSTANNSKNKNLAKSRGSRSASAIAWRWPAVGTVSTVSYGKESRLKGVLIAGKLGQPISAAASGTVVYIGSGLARYGQLVIIKHSDSFFSAYAHLQKIGVQQGQWVQSGEAIATMGTVTGNNKVALRFDIRSGAESLDPLKLLPGL